MTPTATRTALVAAAKAAPVEGVTPLDLKVGDVVRAHGFVCLVDREPQTSTVHREETKWTATRVLNREDVPADVVPAFYTAARDGSPAPRWTIQGNHLALIARVLLDEELAELVAAELEA